MLWQFAFFMLFISAAKADFQILADDLNSIAVTEVFKENRIVPAYFPAAIDTSSLKLFKVENTIIYTGLFSLVASETEVKTFEERYREKFNEKIELLPLKAQTFSYRIEHEGREIASRPLAGGSWNNMPLNLVIKDNNLENELVLDISIKFEWPDQTSRTNSSHKIWHINETPEMLEKNEFTRKFASGTSGLRTIIVKRTLHLKIK